MRRAEAGVEITNTILNRITIMINVKDRTYPGWCWFSSINETYRPTMFSSTDDFPADCDPTTTIWGRSTVCWPMAPNTSWSLFTIGISWSISTPLNQRFYRWKSKGGGAKRNRVDSRDVASHRSLLSWRDRRTVDTKWRCDATLLHWEFELLCPKRRTADNILIPNPPANGSFLKFEPVVPSSRYRYSRYSKTNTAPLLRVSCNIGETIVK